MRTRILTWEDWELSKLGNNLPQDPREEEMCMAARQRRIAATAVGVLMARDRVGLGCTNELQRGALDQQGRLECNEQLRPSR